MKSREDFDGWRWRKEQYKWWQRLSKAMETGNIYVLAHNLAWLELGVWERVTEDERKVGLMSMWKALNAV